MKRLTCAEILLGIQKKTPEVPILIKVPCSNVELACMPNTSYGWDVLAFRPHEFHFNMIARGIGSMELVALQEKYEHR